MAKTTLKYKRGIVSDFINSLYDGLSRGSLSLCEGVTVTDNKLFYGVNSLAELSRTDDKNNPLLAEIKYGYVKIAPSLIVNLYQPRFTCAFGSKGLFGFKLLYRVKMLSEVLATFNNFIENDRLSEEVILKCEKLLEGSTVHSNRERADFQDTLDALAKIAQFICSVDAAEIANRNDSTHNLYGYRLNQLFSSVNVNTDNTYELVSDIDYYGAGVQVGSEKHPSSRTPASVQEMLGEFNTKTALNTYHDISDAFDKKFSALKYLYPVLFKGDAVALVNPRYGKRTEKEMRDLFTGDYPENLVKNSTRVIRQMAYSAPDLGYVLSATNAEFDPFKDTIEVLREVDGKYITTQACMAVSNYFLPHNNKDYMSPPSKYCLVPISEIFNVFKGGRAALSAMRQYIKGGAIEKESEKESSAKDAKIKAKLEKIFGELQDGVVARWIIKNANKLLASFEASEKGAKKLFNSLGNLMDYENNCLGAQWEEIEVALDGERIDFDESVPDFLRIVDIRDDKQNTWKDQTFALNSAYDDFAMPKSPLYDKWSVKNGERIDIGTTENNPRIANPFGQKRLLSLILILSIPYRIEEDERSYTEKMEDEKYISEYVSQIKDYGFGLTPNSFNAVIALIRLRDYETLRNFSTPNMLTELNKIGINQDLFRGVKTVKVKVYKTLPKGLKPATLSNEYIINELDDLF